MRWLPGVFCGCFGVGVLSTTFSGLLMASQMPRRARVDSMPVSVEIAKIGWVKPAGGKRIAFNDAMNEQIYLREESGRVRPIGRRGEGPGEYRTTRYAAIRGDSLLLVDPLTSRRTAFSLGATGYATTTLPQLPVSAHPCLVIAWLDTSGVCEERHQSRATPDSIGTVVRWFGGRPAPRLGPTVQSVSERAHSSTILVNRSKFVVPMPYTWESRGRISSGWRFVGSLSQLQSGRIAEVTIGVWDIAVGASRTLRRRLNAMPVSTSQREALAFGTASEIAASSRAAVGRRQEVATKLKNGWKLGPVAPPYDKIFVTDDGCVMLRRTQLPYVARGAEQVFDRLSWLGVAEKTVSVPASFLVSEATCDMLLGVTNDINGAEMLVVAR